MIDLERLSELIGNLERADRALEAYADGINMSELVDYSLKTYFDRLHRIQGKPETRSGLRVMMNVLQYLSKPDLAEFHEWFAKQQGADGYRGEFYGATGIRTSKTV